MNGIYLLTNYEEIAEKLKHYSISKSVYGELKEPILYEKGDSLLWCEKGILLFNKSKLKILYVDNQFRNNGIGSELIKEMEKHLSENKIYQSIALIPKDKLNFYTKNGFTELSRFVNYIKVKKCWNKLKII